MRFMDEMPEILYIYSFLGQWYEIEWIAPTYQDNGNSWINYYHVYTADRYGVVTGYSSGKDPNSGQCFLGGLVNLKTTDHPAKLKQYTERKKTTIDYWVVDTDYESYAIVYSCVDRANDANNTCSTPRSWTWSRTKSLPDTVKQTARDIFDRLCMNSTLLYVTGFAGEDCDPDTTRSVASTTMNGNLIFVQILIGMLLIFFNMETLS
ncbi:hypothetical protein ACOMHN_002183 [Nucella lapillus]